MAAMDIPSSFSFLVSRATHAYHSSHAVDDVIFLPTSQLVHFTSSRNTDSKRIMAVGPTEELA